MSYTVLFPNIDEAVLSPNPVNAGGEILLSVVVTEISKTLEPFVYYSNEIHSGEVES